MEKKQQLYFNDAPLSTDDYLRQKAATEKLDNISLKNNYAFKKTFKNKTVLKGFLMALLELTEDEIVELEITDPFEEGENNREKEGILDIKVHMNQGVKLNLEMQNRSQYDWSERSIFYNCRMFTDGFLHGMDYGQLEPCIHVGILDFKQLESRGFHHNILLTDKASHEIYSSKFLFHVIELSKLQDATEEEKSRELYQWAVMLAAERWEDICMTVQGNPYREAARDELEKIRQSEIERWIYLREEMAISDERSRLKTAELQGIEIGHAEGRTLERISMVRKKILKGKDCVLIANELEEPEENIRKIYDAIRLHPDQTDEEIYDLMSLAAVCACARPT